MTSIASHIEAALLLIRPKSATPTQIAKYVGCSRKTACRLLYNARNVGICHITGWCPEFQGMRNSWVPLYAHGAGADATKPAPLSAWEKVQQRKARRQRGKPIVPEGVRILNNVILLWSRIRVS